MNMLYPPLNELMAKVDCRYTLVVEAAKRARELVDHAQPLIKTQSNKPVTIAIEEIYAGKIRSRKVSDGEKI